MDSYESDDSLSDVGSGISTNVLLGYASKSPTDDIISHLGGQPTWLEALSHPPPSLVQCKCCSEYLSLLLQLNGDLPERFPKHERRIYVWGCRKKACRRKPGSVRAFRGVRSSNSQKGGQTKATEQRSCNAIVDGSATKAKADIGGALFGSKSNLSSDGNSSSSVGLINPFSMAASGNPFLSAVSNNPFSTTPAPVSSLAAKPPQRTTAGLIDDITRLPATFAAKASISSSAKPATPSPILKSQLSPVPWPQPAQFPKPYTLYHLDADYEFLDSDVHTSSQPTTNHAVFMDVDTDGSSGMGKESGKEDAELFESTHDKAFQHFADILAQNPEQVLRYEFGGVPLLYSRSDTVGRLFITPHHLETSKITTTIKPGQSTVSQIPRCERCGGPRSFELQLTPHAIVELEADEDIATLLGEGMEWGSIIVGVCSQDCGSGDGEVDYVEEWAGVQWEEVVSRKQMN